MTQPLYIDVSENRVGTLDDLIRAMIEEDGFDSAESIADEWSVYHVHIRVNPMTVAEYLEEVEGCVVATPEDPRFDEDVGEVEFRISARVDPDEELIAEILSEF